jgi:radical SAM enzyme (TIGR01210 family)
MRWKLGINTTPCVQSRNGNRCLFCGFLNHHSPVSPREVGQVFCDAFRGGDPHNIHRLELYVSGSFFDDEEVSPGSRLEIAKCVAETEIPEVVLESRPEFMTEEGLRSLACVIDPRRVTIAVGVETTDDGVRGELAKGFSLADLVTSMGLVAGAGMNFQAYLLLNPPAINNDREAIIDVVRSAAEVIGLTRATNCPLVLAIQPFFLAKNSLAAEDPLASGHIRPPWLYTVALTVKLLDIVRDEKGADFQIILGNEVDNVDTVLVPSNYASAGGICPCTEATREQLLEINVSNGRLKESVDRILGSRCHCRTLWQCELGGGFDAYLPTESSYSLGAEMLSNG